MWFIFAIITTLCWGLADLFYKKGADDNDSQSHLKTSAIVGFVMGIHAILTLIFKDINYDFTNILIYLPVSLMYILSMTVGYFGLKYLELSISSPIQNSSGVVAGLLCFIFLKQTIDAVSWVGIILIFIGITLLGIIEKRMQSDVNLPSEKKYKIGFVAFFVPIIYCIIDSLGTFFDGYYLDNFEVSPLVNITEETFEDVANISYEFTFLIFAILIVCYIKFIKKETLFNKKITKHRFFAALLETLGQATYVYALSGGNSVVAAPLIGSYCIFSVIFSSIFLKEKLTKKQYITITIVCIGIVLLGVAEGINI